MSQLSSVQHHNNTRICPDCYREHPVGKDTFIANLNPVDVEEKGANKRDHNSLDATEIYSQRIEHDCPECKEKDALHAISFDSEMHCLKTCLKCMASWE
jgi:DNA-directed RNA polymerase subunit M/transcription elongation factor TFIIS